MDEVSTDVVLVRYGELALKSPEIRNWCEKILIKNIVAMLDSRRIPFLEFAGNGTGYSLRLLILMLPKR
jgi:adenylyl- and sulfurtransferase ThiI